MTTIILILSIVSFLLLIFSIAMLKIASDADDRFDKMLNDYLYKYHSNTKKRLNLSKKTKKNRNNK